MVEKVRFDRLGGFVYSEEAGTYACKKLLAEKVPAEVGRERLDELMAVQQGISLELNREKTGKTLKVLIDEPAAGNPGFDYVGRTEADAPEIDNSVFIKGKKGMAGGFFQVKVENAWEFDLEGRIA
jgi:ribosomal protein S12 methylthiotransferase